MEVITPPKDNIDALPYADREFEVAGAREAVFVWCVVFPLRFFRCAIWD